MGKGYYIYRSDQGLLSRLPFEFVTWINIYWKKRNGVALLLLALLILNTHLSTPLFPIIEGVSPLLVFYESIF